VRGGSGICNGRRERVPGGPFPFSIAVCFLHPVIVGNEVGNTDRSSSFYFLLNAGTAGTRAPVTFFAFTSRTIPLQRDTKEVLPLGILFPATFLSLVFFFPACK
jgi:hypothetical protein